MPRAKKPVHLVRVYSGIAAEKTVCGIFSHDVQDITFKASAATCEQCRSKVQRQWAIKDCRRCRSEFAYVVRPIVSSTGPIYCRPCCHELDAAKAEEAARKHRKKVAPAMVARDNQVRKVKAKGWVTKPERRERVSDQRNKTTA